MLSVTTGGLQAKRTSDVAEFDLLPHPRDDGVKHFTERRVRAEAEHAGCLLGVRDALLHIVGIGRVGNMAEWPKWTPTADIHKRIEGLPASVPGGVDNPLGARALYLYQGNRDTLFRIHGTNQPEYIGASISSGCIRMTNEDVIDLYSRVKQGTVVVVLDPNHGDSPVNSRMALQGGGNSPMLQ